MASENIDSYQEERFISLLSDAVTQVKTEEDPIVLSSYKRLFKANVPLTLRAYVAAYLAKKAVMGGNKNGRNRSHVKNNRNVHSIKKNTTKSAHKGTAPSARVVIDPAVAETIFFSVGRNRGVYPRDLVGVIANMVDIPRERIGDIRVLDNYSFVTVYSEDAQKIIDTINGIDYRNRKLTVSYSKKKNDATEQEAVEKENSLI